MGQEQSRYSTVDRDAAESDKLDSLIGEDEGKPHAVGKLTTSSSKKAGAPQQQALRSSASWKLTKGWKSAPAQPKGSLGGGERTPPLTAVSFSYGREEQEALQDAIKAAVTQQLPVPAPPAEQPEPPGHMPQRMEKAVLARDAAEVRRLVQVEGASLEEETLDGLAAMHVAAAAGHADMVGVLAVLGAGCDVATRDGCDTALHLAAAGGGLNAAGRQECLEVLLGALGAAPDLPNREGRTPLHVAAQTGNMPALAALLAAGAHRACQDREGRRPVDLAAAAGALEAVAYLDALDAKAQGAKLKEYGKWMG